jgi:aryl-alcohol dehydrogenase-like predicted oxidoreductase
VRVLHQAQERGINFFDTADAYAHGDSERLLGEAFHGRRDKVILATKGGYLFHDPSSAVGGLGRVAGLVRKAKQKVESRLLGRKRQFDRQDFSPEYLVQAVERSLRRLNTDYIDLYQLHAPRTEQSQDGEVIETLARLRAAGKIRYFGVGLETLEDVEHWFSHAPLASIQIPFGLLDLEAQSRVLPLARAKNIGLVARGVYGGGLLKPELPPDRLRRMTPKWERIAAFHRIASSAARPIDEIALHYVLQKPEVSCVLLGMRTPAHLEENLRCVMRPALDAELVRAIERVDAEIPLKPEA